MPQSTRDGRPAAPAPIASPRRRRFLFALGATGAGAAVAAAPAVGAAAAAPAAQAAATTSGYRLTEHVRDYYDSTRL